MTSLTTTLPGERTKPPSPLWLFIRRHTTMVLGGSIIVLLVLAALAAPLFAGDPMTMDPRRRLQAPSAAYWLGTDQLGRDVFARVIYGTRVSLQVGLLVAIAAVAVGTLIGLVAGYFRWADAVLTRLMDGFMAIPSILLAIAMVALLGGSIFIVILAIMLPEIPRVTRLVRSVVL